MEDSDEFSKSFSGFIQLENDDNYDKKVESIYPHCRDWSQLMHPNPNTVCLWPLSWQRAEWAVQTHCLLRPGKTSLISQSLRLLHNQKSKSTSSPKSCQHDRMFCIFELQTNPLFLILFCGSIMSSTVFQRFFFPVLKTHITVLLFKYWNNSKSTGNRWHRGVRKKTSLYYPPIPKCVKVYFE